DMKAVLAGSRIEHEVVGPAEAGRQRLVEVGQDLVTADNLDVENIEVVAELGKNARRVEDLVEPGAYSVPAGDAGRVGAHRNARGCAFAEQLDHLPPVNEQVRIAGRAGGCAFLLRRSPADEVQK